jgi:hypothetical protein
MIVQFAAGALGGLLAGLPIGLMLCWYHMRVA